ncbi:MAG: efflux RND transporter permease subunit [Verrucomicrobiae bacterium]|nr:efflux RND transporter permease subunit [Verrucomicrobiae bacterium]
MLNWTIHTALNNRLLICALGGLLVLVGGRSLLHLPVDAFPDTTPVQVQVNTAAPSLSPEEIEQQITIPLELAIGGLPGLANVRSISKFGLSQVVATFDDHTSIYLARQLVMERLGAVSLAEGIGVPELGPISSGLGEVFHYAVRSSDPSRGLAELREMHDWVIKPELRKVPGVAEVNSWGGLEKQFHVLADPDRLIKHGLTLRDLADALGGNNANVGGGVIERGGETLLVHGVGALAGVADIGRVVVAARAGSPVRVMDVADVEIGHEIRRGAVTSGGGGEIVLGLGFMLMGENSAVVTRALKAKLEEVRRSLPGDVTVEVLYDRTELVGKVIRTVEHNLIAGAALVIAVLFAFLGNLRAGLIVASAIPLSMLFAGNLMLQAGIAASLLSLGAIDFGLIVDSSVILVENCARRVAMEPHRPRLDVVREAAIEVRKPTMFGELIILIVFLPILTLEGVEGKMFRPMALTMIFALLGSLVFSLTLMPVLASLLLPRTGAHTEPRLVRWAKRLYAPVLDIAIRRRATVLWGASALVAAAALVASRVGTEFLPKLGEQALAVSTVRLSGISVDESIAWNGRIERALLEEFPDEIARVWTRLGTAEVATDPMGVELSDFFIALKPRHEWTRGRTQPELVEAMRKVFLRQPGMTAAFSQPIEMRFNEMIAGVRGDVAVKIYGDDLDVLRRLSDEVQGVLGGIRGASEVSGEQMNGQPVLRVRVDGDAVDRNGIPRREVLDVVEAVGGLPAGEVREGQRRFPLVIRLDERHRGDPAALAGALVPTASGAILPLGRLAQISEEEGPATINREWARRRVTVQCNVRGRDVGGFVEEAMRTVGRDVSLPEGYAIEWGGQFENMRRANARLAFVVPLALGMIFLLLYFSLGSVRDVAIVATGIPLGAVGGIVALWARDMPLTVSAAIGFVALSGVAILNGLVLMTFIRQRVEAGAALEGAVRDACLARLRPVLMTALVAAVGFIPMAVNVGVGGEVQRPLATVVIGGIFTNTLLTLLVLPALCTLVGKRRHPEGIRG